MRARVERKLERSLWELYMSETYLEELFGGEPRQEAIAALGRVLDLLQGRTHALAGGLAVRAYVRVRPTFDIDVLVDRATLRAVTSALVAEGYGIQSNPGLIGDITSVRKVGIEIDLILPKIKLARGALEEPVLHPLGGRKVPVVSRVRLAALKVFVAAQLKGKEGAKHREDARALVADARALSEVRRLLAEQEPGVLPAFDRMMR